ncbi:hypothetical protein L9F63_002755, partial [Diploptera punctata]
HLREILMRTPEVLSPIACITIFMLSFHVFFSSKPGQRPVASTMSIRALLAPIDSMINETICQSHRSTMSDVLAQYVRRVGSVVIAKTANTKTIFESISDVLDQRLLIRRQYSRSMSDLMFHVITCKYEVIFEKICFAKPLVRS